MRLFGSKAIGDDERGYVLYSAAGLGTFFLGLGDLMNNGPAATVLKLGEVIRLMRPEFESPGVIAFLLLGFLGSSLCWVSRPTSRSEAFARGFSVFAVLAVTAPYETPSSLNVEADGQDSVSLSVPAEVSSMALGFIGISDAHADQGSERAPRTAAATRSIGIEVKGAAGGREPSDVLLTVRKRDTGKIVGRERVLTNRFSVELDDSSYLLELESSGYQRIVLSVDDEEASKDYSIVMKESRLPLNLQRLYRAERVSR